jgi:hypothetical protein
MQNLAGRPSSRNFRADTKIIGGFIESYRRVADFERRVRACEVGKFGEVRIAHQGVDAVNEVLVG